MKIVFDPAKDAANMAKHGLSFGDFDGFDDEPIVRVDDRQDYGEKRYRAFGSVGGELCVVVYTITTDGLRLISFRRSHAKEGRQYARRKKDD